jgi:hypothetical protein
MLPRITIDLDIRLERRTLPAAHWCNASFQATRPESNRNQSGNKTAHGCASFDGHRSKSHYQDNHADEVDGRRPDYGLEFTEILI